MRFYKYWICSCASVFLFSFRIPDLISPPLDPPFIERPEPREVHQAIRELEKLAPLTSAEEYELGLFYILSGDLDKAKFHVTKALEMKSDFPEAQTQMGFLLLWENKPKEAEPYFQEVLKEKSCNKWALNGITQVALKSSEVEALQIYHRIYECDPKNPDVLFYLGQLYRKNNQLQQAKQAYLEALELAPDYQDVAVGLAQVYEQERDYNGVKKLYDRFPSNTDLQRIYTRTLYTTDQYARAFQFYEQLPPNKRIWTERWGVKPQEKATASVEGTYTDAKESDPTLKEPVVKDYYFYGAFNAFIPIYDRWRLDIKGFVYHQRENDIFPPVGVNYNVYMSGGQLLSHYYFAPGWRWDLTARGFEAWGASGNTFYPFIKTTRFEPGTMVMLNTEHLFVADAHIESFIIKNFTTFRSQLLETDYYQTTYGYRPDIFMHPKIEVYAGEIYYHSFQRSRNNWKNRQYLFAQTDLYYSFLKMFYLFEHAGFERLNQNYFSYKNQFRNTIELRFTKELRPSLNFEMFWDHTWEITRTLFLPIGNFIFVSPSLYLIWDTITGQITYNYKDRLKIELGGHYLQNTLPYKDWNLHGSIVWQF